MGPPQLSPQCGDNFPVRKSLGKLNQIQDSRDLAFSGLFFAMDSFVEVDDLATGRALECIGRGLAKSQVCVDGWGGFGLDAR